MQQSGWSGVWPLGSVLAWVVVSLMTISSIVSSTFSGPGDAHFILHVWKRFQSWNPLT